MKIKKKQKNFDTGTRKMYEVKGRCLIGKKQHANGASFRVDSCTNCTCQSGTGVCQRRDCRKSSTSPSNAISRALPQTAIRQSLPTALPASRPLTCSYRSVLYQVIHQHLLRCVIDYWWRKPPYSRRTPRLLMLKTIIKLVNEITE